MDENEKDFSGAVYVCENGCGFERAIFLREQDTLLKAGLKKCSNIQCGGKILRREIEEIEIPYGTEITVAFRESGALLIKTVNGDRSGVAQRIEPEKALELTIGDCLLMCKEMEALDVPRCTPREPSMPEVSDQPQG